MKRKIILLALSFLLTVTLSVFAAQRTVTTYTWDGDIGVQPSGDDGGTTPSDPGYYVGYSGGGAQFSIPSGGNIDGSVYGESISISPNARITGNIVSNTSITLGSGVRVEGFVCSSNGDVILSSANVYVGGEIHAWGNVILNSGATAADHVFATDNVTLNSSGSSVQKNIHAGNDVNINSGCLGNRSVFAGRSLYMFNSNSNVRNDVHAGLNVNLQNRTYIDGSVWAGGSIPNYKQNIGGALFENQPSPPRLLPALPMECPNVPKPQMQTFAAGGTDFVVPQGQSRTITPGTYGTVNFGGAATLTIQAGSCSHVGDTGCYFFDRFQGGLWGQTLRLDLSTGDYITVFSVGDIIYSGNVQVSTDGSTWQSIATMDGDTAKELAKRVYWETHGNFQITTNNSVRHWFGTMLSKNNITIPSGARIIGSVATVDGAISTDSNPQITYVLADFAEQHW